jgi:hypothetical protein
MPLFLKGLILKARLRPVMSVESTTIKIKIAEIITDRVYYF